MSNPKTPRCATHFVINVVPFHPSVYLQTPGPRLPFAGSHFTNPGAIFHAPLRDCMVDAFAVSSTYHVALWAAALTKRPFSRIGGTAQPACLLAPLLQPLLSRGHRINPLPILSRDPSQLQPDLTQPCLAVARLPPRCG